MRILRRISIPGLALSIPFLWFAAEIPADPVPAQIALSAGAALIGLALWFLPSAGGKSDGGDYDYYRSEDPENIFLRGVHPASVDFKAADASSRLREDGLAGWDT